MPFFDLSTNGFTKEPYLRKEKLYSYVNNGLYPYIMYSCYMPVGKPTYFKGNIEAVWEPTQDALDKHKKDQNYELRPYGF